MSKAISSMKDLEICRCQDKIQDLEQHIANCERRIMDLRNIKIQLEDENKKFKRRLSRYE